MTDSERTAITRETAPAQTLVVRREGSAAGWWLAAFLAVVAVFGVIFLINRTTGDDLQAARDQGAVEANQASATAGAQVAATSAARAAQDAAAGAARATESAAQAAAATSRDASARAGEALQDVSPNDPDPL